MTVAASPAAYASRLHQVSSSGLSRGPRAQHTARHGEHASSLLRLHPRQPIARHALHRRHQHHSRAHRITPRQEGLRVHVEIRGVDACPFRGVRAHRRCDPTREVAEALSPCVEDQPHRAANPQWVDLYPGLAARNDFGAGASVELGPRPKAEDDSGDRSAQVPLAPTADLVPKSRSLSSMYQRSVSTISGGWPLASCHPSTANCWPEAVSFRIAA
jgi:hypothetical protein